MFNVKKLSIYVVVIAVSGFLFVWFGVFNVSASDKHWAITSSFLEWVRNRSISARAEDLTVPDLNDTVRIKRGAANYAAMCAQCHLAPGVDTSELHEGLNPQPPVLYKKADFAEKPAETFWVIKNGIKMTGMPAWGIYNSDEQIWDMIATIKAMGKMTPLQYQILVNSGQHTHKGGGHSETGSNRSGHQENMGNSEIGEHSHSQSSEHHASPTQHQDITEKPAGHHDDGHTH